MTLPPISPADKALKQCPKQPGAPAVYLYRGRLTSDADGTFSACYRLKILTSAGKDYASIEIPYSEAWEVRGIRASVMNPDGRLVFFNGEILDKTILQVGGLKRMVKTFALPDVDVGSIISYSYELKWNPKMAAAVRNLSLERWKPEEGGIPNSLKPYALTTEAWDFDAPLCTYKAKYAYIPLGGDIAGGVPGLRVADYQRLKALAAGGGTARNGRLWCVGQRNGIKTERIFTICAGRRQKNGRTGSPDGRNRRRRPRGQRAEGSNL